MNINKKVLVVEDKPEILDFTKRVLERIGCQVITAPSAIEGRQKYAEEEANYPQGFGAVLLDINCGREGESDPQNGFWLTEEIKKYNPRQVIGLMSGYDYKHSKRVDDLVSTRFLHKPADARDIEYFVQNMLHLNVLREIAEAQLAKAS